MTLPHASLVLLLAAKIHGTDAAVRATAKYVIKKRPSSNRALICLSSTAATPEMVRQIELNFDA